MHGWSAAMRPLLGDSAAPLVVRHRETRAGVVPDVAVRTQRAGALMASFVDAIQPVLRGADASLVGLALADPDGVVLAGAPLPGQAAPYVAGTPLLHGLDPAASALRRGRVVVLADDVPGDAHLLVPVRKSSTGVEAVIVARATRPPPAATLALLLQTAHRLGHAAAVEALRAHYEGVIATIGHELRQPLSALVTALDLMERIAPSASPHGLDVARRQTRQLIRVVDSVLDASGLSRRRLAMTPRRIDLRGVVRAAIESVHDAIVARQQRLTLDLPPQPVRCLGDASRLQQVFVNLLTNANRYTPERGSMAVEVRTLAGQVVVRVTDTGIGLESGAADRIFAPFRQESPAAREGLGLGLTICRGIVEGHGGSIAVESAGPGHGSTFIVRLPAPAPPARATLVPPVHRPEVRARPGGRPRSR
jgi:signal transduction histidine kinase